MAAEALEAGKKDPLFSETSLRIILSTILIYWGFVALTFPVTNWDSQVYNLSRLMIAERAGFWQTHAWNSVFQVMWPWTWDAVHFPFLRLGFGFALPSFAALLGILAIIYNLVSPRSGPIPALWACLTVVAMPTIVLQATTTKNDLAVVFEIGCWLYALDRYFKRKRRVYVFLAALGLAFAIGTKTSAIPLSAICTLVTLYLLRCEYSSCLFFVGTYLPLLILFGSVETYALSYKCFHNILGSPGLYQYHANRDGLRGGAANLIRYFFGNLSLGIDGHDQKSGISTFLEKGSKYLLGFLHLTNAGIHSNFTDEKLKFLKTGNSAGMDFGLPGAIAMVASPILLLRFRSNPVGAVTAAAGILALIIISLSIGWQEWNARFLCLPFVLFGIAFAQATFADRSSNRALQALFGFLVIWSVLSFPLLAEYERPADLSEVFRSRKNLQFSERTILKAVYERVSQIHSGEPKTTWFLVADSNSWTLPFMTLRQFDWRSTPQWSTIADWQKENPGKSAYVLILDRPYRNELSADLVASFPGAGLILKIPRSA
jgi:hypothetical protein